MKRIETRRTILCFPRHEHLGFRLEKRVDYNVPAPIIGNNFYKNHSQISSKCIHRRYKGPLYNEAGKICIELTQKYVPLESFVFQTQMDGFQYQICHVQAERIRLRRAYEYKQVMKQRAHLAGLHLQRAKAQQAAKRAEDGMRMQQLHEMNNTLAFEEQVRQHGQGQFLQYLGKNGQHPQMQQP